MGNKTWFLGSSVSMYVSVMCVFLLFNLCVCPRVCLYVNVRVILGAELLYNFVCLYVRNSDEISFKEL